jgi:hypothetical protein
MNQNYYNVVKHSPLFNFLPQSTATVRAPEDIYESVHLGVGAIMPNDLPVLVLSEMAQLDAAYF